MSDSLRSHEPQHARPPCPSPTPRVHPNPCPSSQWCHPTISFSVTAFSSCLQSLPASGSFPVSRLFASGGQSTGASTSASVLPMNSQGWFPRELTGLISLKSKGLRVFSTPQFKSISYSPFSLLYDPTLTSIPNYWKKHIALTKLTFLSKVMSLLFNILSRFAIAFLPRSKHILISWLQSESQWLWNPRK